MGFLRKHLNGPHNNINLGGPGRFNFIFANQFKRASSNNI